ncbi:unnamed protein product [Cylicocyclus nassatus]|uniref:BRCT domain-containing protein n=1 Tax=Cylicocyclus nassatus TaxID=53992 RepID=A0AA36GNY8_CYLNA|nr:unnamed protein product [Cylicocyclus nassatus]
MTTAYNFPDLNISPISIDDEEEAEDSLHTLPVSWLSLSKNTSSGNPSVVPDSDPIPLEAASEDERLNPNPETTADHQIRPSRPSSLRLMIGESFDESSEEVFMAMENRMKHSLFSVAESCDIAEALDDDTFSNILNGCRVCVEMGCCKESSEDVRSRLRRMGAVVSRRFTETTTHVVFSYGGSTEILQSVFESLRRPFLIDPHWVHECFNARARVAEESFSLYECRYLVNTLRRSLDQRNASCSRVVLQDVTNERACIGHPAISEDVEVTFSRSMNASELLLKLDLLSKRLDKIGVTTSCVLGKRCPSALKGGQLQMKQLPTNANMLACRKVPSIVKITRRRTHGAFPLEYREPANVAVKVIREAREEQAAVSGYPTTSVANAEAAKENEEPRNTLACDLPHVPKNGNKKFTKNFGLQQKSSESKSPRKCSSSSGNSTEMGLLGFKSLSQCGAYAPLVETASSMINQLQSASSSAEFVGKKHTSKIGGKTRDGVVFTGFVKEKERELHAYVRDLGLKVHSKISARTYCVVSANGERTLNTMRAVVNAIPVVEPEWLETCADHNKLLPVDDYEHERWAELIKRRQEYCEVFADYGKILICDECSPPSDVLRWMIEKSGGEVTTDPLDCSLIVAPHNHSLEIYCSEELEVPPPVVVEKYILDCICENEVLDVDDYMEHQVVDDLLIMPNTRLSSVLLLGGCTEAAEGGALRSFEEVNFSCFPANGINIASGLTGNLNQPRRSPAVLRGKGSIYVIGGCLEKGCHVDTVEQISFYDGEWVGSSRNTVDVEPRSCTAFCNLDEQCGLVIGGFNGTDCLKTVALIQEIGHEVYSKRLNDLPFRLKNSVAVSISNDTALLFGGWDESSTMRTVFRLQFDRECESYQLDMESLLPYAVEGHCCVSHSGYIYVIGGYDDVSVVNTIVRYSTATKNSEILPTRLAIARENHVCEIVLERYIVVMAEEHSYLVPVNVEFKLSQKRNRPASIAI